MDYRIDPEADEMRTALVAFLRDRLPDPGSEPDRDRRAGAWRDLAASEWLEHYATALDATPAGRVVALHVTEGFGTVPVTGPVDLVAGYLVPLAASVDWAALLERLRAGAVVTGTVPVLDEPGAAAVPWRSCARLATGRAQGLRVRGRFRGVIAAAEASVLVVPISLDGEPALAVADLDRPGVTVGAPTGADLRQPVAEVTLDDVALDPETVWTGAGLLDHEHRCAVTHSLFLDAEAVGGATEAITRTVRHCREREQFGRPIGSFQAIRHRLADAHAAVEGARSLAQRAAWSVATDAAGASADVVASRLWSAAAYVGAAEAAVQCHGGMGFTWEQGVHVFYRAALAGRARSAEVRARAALAAHLRGVGSAPRAERGPLEARTRGPQPVTSTGGAF